MDELLSDSPQDEFNWTFSDHYISDDEDLLPINCYKTIGSKQSETIELNEDKNQPKDDNCVVNDVNDVNDVIDGNNFTKIVQKCDFNEKLSNSKDIDIEVNKDNDLKKSSFTVDYNKSTNKTTYYSECPICESFGHKSINHIKQCAQKRSVDPKRVLQLLKDCKKSDICVETHKRKLLKSKPKTKKSNKIINNYVIHFEAEKGLKLSIDPKLNCNKKSVKNGMTYELSLLSLKERQILLETKICDQMMGNIVDNIATQEDVDKPLLPNLWKVALLESQLNDYIVEDFHKYILNN